MSTKAASAKFSFKWSTSNLIVVRSNHTRAIAQPCVNGDRLSMENGEIRPTVPNFVQIRPSGAFRQMGEV